MAELGQRVEGPASARSDDEALTPALRRAARSVGAVGGAVLRVDRIGAAVVAGFGIDDATAAALETDAAVMEVSAMACVLRLDDAGPHLLAAPCGRGVAERFVVVFARVDGSFGPADLRAAREAQAWLCDLVGLWWRGREAGQRAAGLAAATGADDAGLVLLDGDARILSMNPAAEAVLAAGDGLRRTGPMLVAARFEDSIRLQAAVHQAVASARAGGGSVTMVALRRRGKRPLVATVAPIPGPASPGAALAFVRVVDPEQDLDDAVAPVCGLYGLTGAEARLARQLAGGASLSEAAARLRIQPDTARAYLKAVFAKTGVKRQALLVQLLLQSRARLAPGARIATA